jgi:hypothetical protein
MSVSLVKRTSATTTITLYGHSAGRRAKVRNLAQASFAGVAAGPYVITDVAYDGTARSVWTVTAYVR